MKKDGEEKREKKSGEIERREMQKQEEKKEEFETKLERRERKRCGKD